MNGDESARLINVWRKIRLRGKTMAHEADGPVSLDGIVTMFPYGILAVATLSLLGMLISGLFGNADLTNRFNLIVWAAMGIFLLIAVLKISRKMN